MKRRWTDAEQEAMDRFHQIAVERPCAACGATGHREPHHVVEQKHLDRERLWDPDNALPLCGRFSENGCHERHTNASRRVPFRKLRAENVEFAYEVLGDYASDYLRAKYPVGES